MYAGTASRRRNWRAHFQNLLSPLLDWVSFGNVLFNYAYTLLCTQQKAITHNTLINSLYMAYIALPVDRLYKH